MVLKRCQCCINDLAVHHFMNRLNRYQLRKQVLTHSGSTWQNVGGFVTNSTSFTGHGGIRQSAEQLHIFVKCEKTA